MISKQRGRFARILALVAGLLLTPTTASAEPINVHGSSTVFGTVVSPHRFHIEQDCGFPLNLVANGSGQGIKDLIDGEAEVAMISAPLPEVMNQIGSDRPETLMGWNSPLVRQSLVAHPIGGTRVAFAVNSQNPVRELSFEQVIDILSGRITSWNDLGGEDEPIEIIVELRGGGVRTLVEKQLAMAGEVLARVTTVQTAAMAAYAVDHISNGLGITTDAAIALHSAQAVTVDTPIEQPMFLVTMGEPNRKARRFIESVRKVGEG